MQNIGEQMADSVFSKAGHFITVPLTDRCTNIMLTAAWTAVGQHQVFFTRHQHRQVFMDLSCVNTSAPTAAVTTASLAMNRVQLVPQLPYSLDLYLCIWFLCPHTKQQQAWSADIAIQNLMTGIHETTLVVV